MPYIGRGTDKLSNVEVLDNITFDGSSSYTLQKGGVNFTPSSANNILISIDGVVQAGNFTVSSSTIDFGTAVAGTSTCDFILHYGIGLITTPADGTVTEAKIGTGAVTSSKLASGAVPNQSAFKNIIINGDMSIAQRSTSVAGITATAYNTMDRWRFNINGGSMGTWTMSQSTDVPSGQGFAKSLKLDCTTADASPTASEFLNIEQRFEGQMLQYLKKGTANAESLTLSFWVKSNKTGTYIAEIIDTDNDRNNVNAYTINSANTWEKKTITISGDTTGTLDNDNLVSMRASFYLGAGSDYTSGSLQSGWGARNNANRLVGQVNLADSTSNEWYITGVQLEVGSAASDFEFLPYDVNLQRCQRYYNMVANGSDNQYAIINTAAVWENNSFNLGYSYPVAMRAAPSADSASGTNYFYFGSPSENQTPSSLAVSDGTTKTTRIYQFVGSGTLTNGKGGICRLNNSSAYFALNAEL